MNATLAAFHLVADYRGGAVALAPLMGKNSATLSHEVNPNYGGAKLGLEDAIKLSVLTEDLRIATAFAAQVGCMLVPLPKKTSRVAAAADSYIAMSTMAKEFSQLVGQVTEALADGRVTANDMRAVEREASELVAAVQVTVLNLQQRMDADLYARVEAMAR